MRMKFKDQAALGDGFDKNVAEKMPKLKKWEDGPSPDGEAERLSLKEEGQEKVREETELEKPAAEKKALFQAPGELRESSEPLDVLKLIEDLHGQVLASSRIKRALEMDLAASQKTIHQLALDNKALRAEREALHKQLQKVKEIESESTYLREENEDALEKIGDLQEELRNVKEALASALREKEEALKQIRQLEARAEQNELLGLRERMKEKEASQLSEENKEIRMKLEEALTRNADLEKRYETLKKSFEEVKESLSLLRESYKASYYNMTERPE